MNGAKLIADAIIGTRFRTVLIGGRAYTIKPPTIHRICGAISCLADMGQAKDLRGLLLSMGGSDAYCEALSWFIKGDASLKEELMEGTLEECATALEEAVSLIDVQVFINAVSLARSVSVLAAKQR